MSLRIITWIVDKNTSFRGGSRDVLTFFTRRYVFIFDFYSFDKVFIRTDCQTESPFYSGFFRKRTTA